MNILIVYKSLALGGQQTQLLNLALQFKEQGHVVTWAYETPGPMLEEVSQTAALCPVSIGVDHYPPRSYRRRIFRLGRAALVFARRWHAYRSAINKIDPDLILVSDSYTSFVIGAFQKSKRMFRMIGQDIEQLEPIFKYYRLLKIDRGVEKYFGWQVPYASLLKVGVSSSKLVRFQHNAVDTKTYRPLTSSQRRLARRKFCIDESDFVIGWVGRLEPRMQVEATIDQVSKLVSSGLGNVKLLIVGGGLINEEGVEDQSYPKRLRKKIEELNLEGVTTFTGWIPQAQMPEVINCIDVMPLLEIDPQGGSILREAMACGRVAMTVDGASGVQRQFAYSPHAILLPAAVYQNAAHLELTNLYLRRNELEEIGRAARKFAEEEMSFETQAHEILVEFNGAQS